ncbi:streptococcal hemagglutinin [Anopheles aquasalis]|uniref:streptococcal hemagglutinin n=1 Tax=Anopheles aquasalis TaxID=42839 RepID=UPI00215A923D|nr:streptococcal hemagglutinin [Anopheles aquasalis]
MERFSINILHQQIYRVCRLCGVDHPDKLPIIEDDDVVILFDEEDEETSLVKKIEECVGILVHKDDKMPQLICQLCLEKVNDFYEYRSMCAATNVQTRTLLNLHMVHPVVKKVKIELPPVQEEIVPEIPELEEMEDVEEVVESRSALATKTTNPRDDRSSMDYNGESEDLEKIIPKKRIKFQHGCEYCKDVFTESLGLLEHLKRRHTPRVYRYACYTCCEYFETQRDLKDHESWHKATRTKYQCFRCSKKFVASKTLTTHIDTNACVRPERSVVPVQLVPDLRCPECRKLFKTRNLYEWHSCFLKAKTNCPKCGKFFRQKQPLLRHYILYCSGTLPIREPLWETLKNEAIESKPDIYFPLEPVPGGTGAMGDRKRARGRPPGKKSSDQQQFNDEMKVEAEEQCELPYPPPLEVCMTVKSEEPTSTIPATGRLLDDSPVTSRLRSGTMPINSSDSATTSVDKKDRRNRRTRSSTIVEEEQEERTVRDTDSATSESTLSATSPTKPPMVTLSMETIKQEFLEMNELRKQLAGSLSQNDEPPTETPKASDEVNENTHVAGTTEDDHAGDNWQDDGNDHSNDSDDNAAYTPLPEMTNTDEVADGTEETVASENAASPLENPVHPTGESGTGEIEGVESEHISLPADIAIKQEPQDGGMPIVQSPLRITIKKEKGLLNDGGGVSGGTISWTIEPSATDDPLYQAAVPTKPSKRTSPSKKASKRKEKRSLPSDTHREERSVSKKPRQQCPVRVKQEVPDPEDDNDENQNDLPIAEDDGSVVRIKPEPIDPGYIERPIKSEFPSASLHAHAHQDHSSDSANQNEGMDTVNEPVVAFDGVHIKLERFAANDNSANDGINNSSFCGVGEEVRSNRIVSNPFSKSVRKSDENTLRRKTQEAKAKSKLNKMINPFALMKQKATQDQRRAISDLPTKSTPAISEVDSSDPAADQLALNSSPLSTSNLLNHQTHAEDSSASEIEAAQKPQSEMRQEFPDFGGTSGENEENSSNSTTDAVTKQSNDHNLATAIGNSDESVESNEETAQDQHSTEVTDTANPSSQLSVENEDAIDNMNEDQPVIAEFTSKLLSVNQSETLKMKSIEFQRDSSAGDEFKENLTKSSEVNNEILDQALSNSEQSIDEDDSRNNVISMEQKTMEIPEVAHASDTKEVKSKTSPPKMVETYAATPEEEAGSSKQDLATSDIPEDLENDQELLPSTDSSEVDNSAGNFQSNVGSQTGKETVNPIIGASSSVADEGSCSAKAKTSAALDVLMDGSEVRRSSSEKDAEVVNEVSHDLSVVNTDNIKQPASSVAENATTLS